MLRPIPFPLASGRYEVGPAMRRFGQAGMGLPAEAGHFQPDAGLAATLAVLRRAPRACHLAAPGPAAAVRARLAGRAGLWRLGDALALAVPGDLAIVRGPAGADVLEWLHMCLPSGWVPAEKLGRSFAAVHAPVVHSAPLLASQAPIVRAMIHAGPFVRYVWGIHRDGELCHNPRLHRPAPWPAGAAPADLAARAWFRVERQNTRGFPHLDRALFTIRYWVAPLAEVAADPWRRERLAAALAGMDDAELAYKGPTGARDGLVSWLKGQG